jgi:hypothetical protein
VHGVAKARSIYKDHLLVVDFYFIDFNASSSFNK